MADVELLPCAECGMPCRAGEYHPFAACLMFKACHNSETVRANLATLQAENERLRAEVESLRAELIRVTKPDGSPNLLAEQVGAAESYRVAAIHANHKRDEAEARADRLAEALRWAERHCPCGARPESPDTHPHLPGCLVGAALAQEDRND